MREPIDYDHDREEELIRRRERLRSPVCLCGKAKAPGSLLCPDCEQWEMDELIRINPPSRD